MLGGQVIQSTLDGISSIMHTSLAVCDTNGKILNHTGEIRDANERFIEAFAMSDAVEQSAGDLLMYKVFNEHEPEYVVLASINEANSRAALRLCAMQLESLNIAYRERFDKDNFIKNLLLDNLLVIDIYNRAKKLRIDINADRAVFLAETRGSEAPGREIIKEAFRESAGEDFVTTVDENYVVLVKQIKADQEQQGEELLACAEIMEKELKAHGIDSRISYGSVIKDIREVSKSYKEAKLALDVGRIFYEDRQIVGYSNLGIGRLIYQLPINLCRMFISEIFDGKTPDDLDEETLTTIQRFFENNLNVSETSRQLFIHRNTLVYRLDKLQKSTGLDLRIFDDAITFKIALMVVKYMDYIEKNEY